MICSLVRAYLPMPILDAIQDSRGVFLIIVAFMVSLVAVPAAIKRLALFVRKIVCAKGDDPAVGTDHVNEAFAQPLQVEVPGVLKRHSGDTQRVTVNPVQKRVQT